MARGLAARAAPACFLVLSMMVALKGCTTTSAQQPATVLPSRPDHPDAPAAVSFTYPASAGRTIVNAIAVDAAGYIYLTGTTTAAELPAADNAFQKQLRGSIDAFVAKIDPSGKPVWSTYLGGNDARGSRGSGDVASAIAVDGSGYVYVAGHTPSTDFPLERPYQSQPQATRTPPGAASDGFVAKLTPDGERLVYSTYVGSPGGSSWIQGIAAGAAGEAWIALSAAQDFAVTRDLSRDAGSPLVVMRLAPQGSRVWAVRIGQRGDEFGALAVDPAGEVYLAGAARTTCTHSESPGPYCLSAFLTRLNLAGAQQRFRTTFGGTRSTFINGAAYTAARDLTLMPDGSVLMVGSTSDTDLPLRRAWQPTSGGETDTFVATFTANGELLSSSYAGGNDADTLGLRAHVAVDLHGIPHVAWDTKSTNLEGRAALTARHVDGPVFTMDARAAQWRWASDGVAGSAHGLVIDAERNLAYVATDLGVFRSGDNGETWTRMNAGLNLPDGNINQREGPVEALALDPRRPATLYAGVRRAFFRSDNGGETWTQMRAAGAGVGGFSVRTLAVSPHDGSVWVAPGSGVEVTTDGGRTWEPRNTGLLRTVVGTFDTPNVLVVNPHRAGVVYAGIWRGLFATFDNGATWEEVTREVPGRYPGDRPSIADIAVDPVDANRIYAISSFGLLTSTDGGRTWSVGPSPGISNIVIDPSSPATVYGGAFDVERGPRVLQSQDRGLTWRALGEGLTTRGVPRVVVHPRDGSRLYATARLNFVPFFFRLVRRTGDAVGDIPQFFPTLSSYLPLGQVRDVAATPDGSTVLALSVQSGSGALREETVIVRVDPLPAPAGTPFRRR
jgi:hypothetical protein